MNVFIQFLYLSALYVAVGFGYSLSFVAVMNSDATDDPMTPWEIIQVIGLWPYYVWLDYAEGGE